MAKEHDVLVVYTLLAVYLPAVVAFAGHVRFVGTILLEAHDGTALVTNHTSAGTSSSKSDVCTDWNAST